MARKHLDILVDFVAESYRCHASITFILCCIMAALSCNHNKVNQPICMDILKDTTFTLKSDNWSGGVSNISLSMNTRIDSILKIALSYPKEIQPSTIYTFNYSKGSIKVDTCLEYYAQSVSVQIFFKNKPSNPLPICFKFNDFRLSRVKNLWSNKTSIIGIHCTQHTSRKIDDKRSFCLPR